MENGIMEINFTRASDRCFIKTYLALKPSCAKKIKTEILKHPQLIVENSLNIYKDTITDIKWNASL